MSRVRVITADVKTTRRKVTVHLSAPVGMPDSDLIDSVLRVLGGQQTKVTYSIV